MFQREFGFDSTDEYIDTCIQTTLDCSEDNKKCEKNCEKDAEKAEEDALKKVEGRVTKCKDKCPNVTDTPLAVDRNRKKSSGDPDFEMLQFMDFIP